MITGNGGKSVAFGIQLSKCVANDELLGRPSKSTLMFPLGRTLNNSQCEDGPMLDTPALSTAHSKEAEGTRVTSSIDDNIGIKVPFVVSACCAHLLKYGQ